jgi:signal transduction histidine kinase
VALGTDPSAEELTRRRHSARMALCRAVLAVAYLSAEGFLSAQGLGRSAAFVVGAFVVYSLFLLVYHAHPALRNLRLFILFLDLVFLLSLIFWRTTPQAAALAGMFYGFLVLESWSQPASREVVLAATSLSLLVHSLRLGSSGTTPVVVTVQSVLFLLVVAGLAAFLFSDQRYLAERRILALATQRVEASETATVATIQESLRELAVWFRCSHALLAFWNEPHDHFCLCRYPPPEGTGENLLEDSREWSVCRGERLDFLANDLKLPEGGARSVSADFDLHPHLVRKFQVANALGCGLHQDGKAFGRLLLLNRVSPMRPYLQRRLRRVAPAFNRLAQHVLVIKAVEHAAYERERARVAQDFHDGPLQSVISFQMRVHTIRKLLERDPEAAGSELDQLQEVARKQVAEMRTFVNSMRPVEVDTSSLTAAARRLVEDFQKESGVPVTFLSGEQPVSVSGRVGVDILQIIREALHNIHKHAQATHVVFSLEQNDTTLAVGVSDNGKGFRFGGRYSLEELDQLRLGPNSIKQRMRALGGDLVLESQPGHGTSLRMKIPLY